MKKRDRRLESQEYMRRADVKKRRAARFKKRAQDPLKRPKILARYKLKYAVASGKMSRGLCEFDGCLDPMTHGHHEDYSKPLEVRWLCRKHHAQRHRELEGAI